MADDLFKLLLKHHKGGCQFVDESKLYYDELKELRKRKFRKILEQQYYLETLGEYYKDMKKLEISNMDKIKEKIAKEHNNGYVWITINPQPKTKLSDFMKKISKLAKRKIFRTALYVYEQRGTDPATAGSGFHCHMLAKRNLNYKPCKVSECIRNSCKTLVKNAKNNATLNIQHIGDEFAKDKREYILGEKTGEGKDKKQEMDVIWRKKNNIDVYYNEEGVNETSSFKAQKTGKP